MKLLVGISLLLCLVVGGLHAEVIYQCEGAAGEPVFSNVHCGGGAQKVELGSPAVLGGAPPLAQTRRQIRALQSMPVTESGPRRRPSSRQGLGFGERMELRRLEIRADGLRRDLDGKGRSANSRQALKRELVETARRIRELRTLRDGS